MKKMKITENELVTLIEKIVNEQATGVALGGFGQNMGFSKPTDKYEDLNLEGDDIEDEVAEDDVEEDVYESEIVERLRKRMGSRKFPEKANETISEQRNVVKWLQGEKDDVIEMVTALYNDMVNRKETTQGPQG